MPTYKVPNQTLCTKQSIKYLQIYHSDRCTHHIMALYAMISWKGDWDSVFGEDFEHDRFEILVFPSPTGLHVVIFSGFLNWFEVDSPDCSTSIGNITFLKTLSSTDYFFSNSTGSFVTSLHLLRFKGETRSAGAQGHTWVDVGEYEFGGEWDVT